LNKIYTGSGRKIFIELGKKQAGKARCAR